MTSYAPNFLSLLALFFVFQINAQDEDNTRYTSSNKGKVFFSWGGNRGAFSNSEIRFKGNGFDFTIEDATARDKPKGWNIDYINPTRITIPQTNAKLGFFISEHYTIALGLDHMKYVMNRNRNRTVNGFIDIPEGEPGSEFNGVFNNETVFVSEDLLKFEHTNGLNYIYAELARFDDISGIFGIGNTDKFQINITEGLGGGVLYPKTNTTLLQKERYDEFNVAGYGISANVGLNLIFFKHFFIQLDARGGFINMNDIRITTDTSEHAEQHFYFFQRIISFGGIFRL